jgi:kumamolisin
MARTRPRRKTLPELPGGTDAVPPDTELTISVYLRHRRKVRRRPGSAPDLAELTRRVTPDELKAERERLLKGPVKRIAQFAERTGMRVLDTDHQRRCVTLGATAAAIERAFATRLVHSEGAPSQHYYPARAPTLPKPLADLVHGIVGLDTRPAIGGRLRPHAAAATGPGLTGPGLTGPSLLPSEIARLYGIATAGRGAGQCIAVIEPAGGYSRDDVAAACRAMNVPVPQLVDINVGGGANRPGVDSRADEEVALDIQVIAGVAPEARIAVYFTDLNERGLVAGLAEAVHGTTARPSVIVVTWGEPEEFWPPDVRDSFDAVLHDAMRLGITVVATAGDDLATERMNDGKVHVNYPGSSPYVLSCGGTAITLDADRSAIADEVVWKEGLRGTGGGISPTYAVPAFQARVDGLPGSRNDGKPGRGVPDVAAAAARRNGYRILIGADAIVGSGTSAVAPLWGAFIALLNEQRTQTLGFVNTRLYGAPDLLKVITSGDNMDHSGLGYAARNGWSACTGLGSPKGAAIIASLTAMV